MTRLKAGLSHLSLSFLIFIIVISVLLYFWFPAPYFTASGGWQGLKIVAAVDLVLGPLLTLIIFDLAKSRAKLIGDLAVIVLFQLSALVWGIHTIYEQRPIVVAFWETDFITIPAVNMQKQGVSLDELKVFGEQYPVFVYAQKPTSLAGLEKMARRISEQKIPPHEQFELYQPLKTHYAEIKSHQVDINEILTVNAKMKADLMAIIEKSNTEIHDYDYFPLRSKYHTIILMFSHSGELINYIAVSAQK